MLPIVGTAVAVLFFEPSVVSGLRVHDPIASPPGESKEGRADEIGMAASTATGDAETFDEYGEFAEGKPKKKKEPCATAEGDPHVKSITGETFDLWKTGWSTFVQIPAHVPDGEESKLLVRGLVESYSPSAPCAPAFLREVLISGSSLSNKTIAVRAGSLETEEPFALSYDGGVWEPVSEETSGTKQLGGGATVETSIVAPEPELWGPDAHTSITVAGTTVDIQQHTEGRKDTSRSMLDLAVSGLDDTTDSVGGWLGMDGSKLAGSPPEECGVALVAKKKPIVADSIGFKSHYTSGI